VYLRGPPLNVVSHVLAQLPPQHSAFELPVLLILLYIFSSQPNSKVKVKSFSGEMMCLLFLVRTAVDDEHKKKSSRPVVSSLSIRRALYSDSIIQSVSMATQINIFPMRPLHFINVSVGRWQCLHVASHIYVHNPLLSYSDMRPRIRSALISLFGDLNDDSFAINLTACQILDSFLSIRSV